MIRIGIIGEVRDNYTDSLMLKTNENEDGDGEFNEGKNLSQGLLNQNHVSLTLYLLMKFFSTCFHH